MPGHSESRMALTISLLLLGPNTKYVTSDLLLPQIVAVCVICFAVVVYARSPLDREAQPANISLQKV